MKSSNLTILQNLWKHAGLDLITLQIRFFNSLISKFRFLSFFINILTSTLKSAKQVDDLHNL